MEKRITLPIGLLRFPGHVSGPGGGGEEGEDHEMRLGGDGGGLLVYVLLAKA
jgi:hypothetical protein